MSSIDSLNGYTPAPRVHAATPVRHKDDDTERYRAQAQTRSDNPAVKVTLSPDAQRALAAQKTGQGPPG